MPWFVRVGSYCESCRSKTSDLIQRGLLVNASPSYKYSVACVYAGKAHGSMSLYDDTRSTISAR